MAQPTLDALIREELDLIEDIKRNSQRLSQPLFGALARTFGPPMLVFMAFTALSTLLVNAVERAFPGGMLSVTLYLVGLLVTIVLMWCVWRAMEARHGGAALIRRLGEVTMAVREAERAIEAARAQAEPSRQQLADIRARTRAAWQVYAEAMRAHGLDVTPE